MNSCLLWTGVIQSASTMATALRPCGSCVSSVLPLVVPARPRPAPPPSRATPPPPRVPVETLSQALQDRAERDPVGRGGAGRSKVGKQQDLLRPGAR